MGKSKKHNQGRNQSSNRPPSNGQQGQRTQGGSSQASGGSTAQASGGSTAQATQGGAAPKVGSLTTALDALKRAAAAEGIPTDKTNAPAGIKSPPALPPAAAMPTLIALVEAFQAARTDQDRREADLLKDMETHESEKTQCRLEVARLDKLKADTEGQAQTLKAQRQALAEEQANAATRARSLRDAEGDLKARQAKLLDREEALTAREIDAEAGFLTLREQSLSALNKAHARLLEENGALALDLEEARQRHADELLEREAHHRARLKAEEARLREAAQAREAERDAALERLQAEIDAERGELEALARTLKVEGQQLKRAREDLRALREDLDAYAQERAREEVEALKGELRRAQERQAPLQERCEALEAQLQARQDAERRLGHETPEQVQRRLSDQAEMIQSLRDDLANRPSAAEVEELRHLRQARDTWSAERDDLGQKLNQAHRRLNTLQISSAEAEMLRDRNTAMEANQRLLKAALETLQGDLDERLNAGRDQPTFPELLRMDVDATLQASSPALYRKPEGAGDLAPFVEDLRHRLAARKEGQPPLYYSSRDLRSFLGGMAMSRLHLLQGISGIGKSSLARRFAEAIGGGCETVTVQAGWTDKMDLFGSFNSFEGRFFETALVQALYKAQTPAYQDRVMIILLDEMNLSHPEQYGADILDVLERTDPRERRFELMAHQPSGKHPKGLIDGRRLPLPDNVWFIGTANHDETTKDFADKTYDRSYVLELPPMPEPFKAGSKRDRQPVSLARLHSAFDEAIEGHAKEAEQALTWLDVCLREPMAETFQIGWGGRLAGQARRYIPVVVAAGGSWGEGLDQIIATRILRRIRGRHDLLSEDLRDLEKIFTEHWEDPAHPPEACLRILRAEQRRFGGA